jgi:hypothetical protein
MKLTASRIERMLEKIEALAPPPQKWKWPGPPGRLLHTVVHEGDDEAETKARQKEAQEKALAEHIAAHPEHAGRTVEDFFWIIHQIVRVKRREDGTPVLSEPPTIDVGDTDDLGSSHGSRGQPRVPPGAKRAYGL